MSIKNKPTNGDQIPSRYKSNVRKPYCKPQVMELGDLRSLTLGISPTGNQDSSGGLFTESIRPHLLINPQSTQTPFP